MTPDEAIAALEAIRHPRVRLEGRLEGGGVRVRLGDAAIPFADPTWALYWAEREMEKGEAPKE